MSDNVPFKMNGVIKYCTTTYVRINCMQYYLRTIKFDFIPMKYTYGREGSILILLLQLRTQYLREHQLYAIFITYVRENLILLIRVDVHTGGEGFCFYYCE